MMSVVLRCFVAGFCIVLFAYVVHLVGRERLQLKYSLLWLLLTVILLLVVIFPQTLIGISVLFGFETPSNFAFFIGLFCLLAISLSLSVIVSKQALKIKNITQSIALLEIQCKTGQTKHKD